MLESYLKEAYNKRQSEINEILSEWSLSAGNLIRQKQGRTSVPYITVHILKRLMIALDVAQLIDDHLMSSVKELNVPEQEPRVVAYAEVCPTGEPEDDAEPPCEEVDYNDSWLLEFDAEHSRLCGAYPETETDRFLSCEDHT
jgi:hypothetical protein